MTEFVQTLRHYCRNPRCRMKLKAPVENPREAFCTKGCHASFYLHRCLACEAEMERKRDDQKVCRKAKCRNTWKAGQGFGRHAVPPDAKLASKTLDFIGSKPPAKPDRPWYIVAAGVAISANTFHCATAGSSLI